MLVEGFRTYQARLFTRSPLVPIGSATLGEIARRRLATPLPGSCIRFASGIRNAVMIVSGSRLWIGTVVHSALAAFCQTHRSITSGAMISWCGRVLPRSACMLICLAAVSSQNIVAAAPLPAVREACGAEIRSLCLRPWRLTPDAISSCVEDNRVDLSPTCRAFWGTTHMCLQEMKEVCGGLNPLTIRRCLRKSPSQLSQTCQEMLDGR